MKKIKSFFAFLMTVVMVIGLLSGFSITVNAATQPGAPAKTAFNNGSYNIAAITYGQTVNGENIYVGVRGAATAAIYTSKDALSWVKRYVLADGSLTFGIHSYTAGAKSVTYNGRDKVFAAVACGNADAFQTHGATKSAIFSSNDGINWAEVSYAGYEYGSETPLAVKPLFSTIYYDGGYYFAGDASGNKTGDISLTSGIWQSADLKKWYKTINSLPSSGGQNSIIRGLVAGKMPDGDTTRDVIIAYNHNSYEGSGDNRGMINKYAVKNAGTDWSDSLTWLDMNATRYIAEVTYVPEANRFYASSSSGGSYLFEFGVNGGGYRWNTVIENGNMLFMKDNTSGTQVNAGTLALSSDGSNLYAASFAANSGEKAYVHKMPINGAPSLNLITPLPTLTPSTGGDWLHGRYAKGERLGGKTVFLGDNRAATAPFSGVTGGVLAVFDSGANTYNKVVDYYDSYNVDLTASRTDAVGNSINVPQGAPTVQLAYSAEALDHTGMNILSLNNWSVNGVQGGIEGAKITYNSVQNKYILTVTSDINNTAPDSLIVKAGFGAAVGGVNVGGANKEVTFNPVTIVYQTPPVPDHIEMPAANGALLAVNSSNLTASGNYGALIINNKGGTMTEKPDYAITKGGQPNPAGSGISVDANGLVTVTYPIIAGDYTVTASYTGLVSVSKTFKVREMLPQLSDIAYGNGKFVSVMRKSYAGVPDRLIILTSADGNEWNISNSVDTVGSVNDPGVISVEFINGKFYIATQIGILISADGLNWTTAPIPEQFTTLTYDGTKWIAGTRGNTSAGAKIYTAADGFAGAADWTYVAGADAAASANSRWRSIATDGNGHSVIIKNSAWDDNSEVIYVNGNTFIKSDVPVSASDRIFKVVYDGNVDKFILLCNNNYIYYAVLNPGKTAITGYERIRATGIAGNMAMSIAVGNNTMIIQVQDKCQIYLIWGWGIFW